MEWSRCTVVAAKRYSKGLTQKQEREIIRGGEAPVPVITPQHSVLLSDKQREALVRRSYQLAVRVQVAVRDACGYAVTLDEALIVARLLVLDLVADGRGHSLLQLLDTAKQELKP
jgi:hypothetical protein